MTLPVLKGAWLEASDTLDAHMSRCASGACDSCFRLNAVEINAHNAYLRALRSPSVS